jgi:hypothetical protein
LNARQCGEAGGLRAKNEPLATDANLRRTARTAKNEEARCANACNVRMTTRRTKHCKAGRPETTQNAWPMRSKKAAHTTQLQKDAALPPNAGIKRRRSRPLE